MGLERFSAFLPYDTFEIETPYTPAEVVERIQGLIAERPVFDIKGSLQRAFQFQQPTRPFLGTVDSQGFHLYPSQRNRNSARPQFYGTITPTANGTLVTGKIQIHAAVLLFLAIGFVYVLIFFFIFLVTLTGNNDEISPLCFISAFPLIVYIVVMVGFYGEATPAKKALLQVLTVPIEKAV